MLVMSDTQIRAQPCSPAHLPAVPAVPGSLELQGDACVSPPPCATITTCQTARGSARSLCRQLCCSHRNRTAGLIVPSLAPLSLQRPVDTSNVSAPFQGLCTHMGLYLVIFPKPPTAQGCTDCTVPSSTTGAGLGATHASLSPPSPFSDAFYVASLYCSCISQAARATGCG